MYDKCLQAPLPKAKLWSSWPINQCLLVGLPDRRALLLLMWSYWACPSVLSTCPLMPFHCKKWTWNSSLHIEMSNFFDKTELIIRNTVQNKLSSNHGLIEFWTVQTAELHRMCFCRFWMQMSSETALSADTVEMKNSKQKEQKLNLARLM